MNDLKKQDLIHIAKDYNIKFNTTKDELYNNIIKRINQRNDISKLLDYLRIKFTNTNVPNSINDVTVFDKISPTRKKFEQFIAFMRDDFLEIFENDNPKMRSFVPGGYGAKVLLEDKYNKVKEIYTSDLDITISCNNCSLNNVQLKEYLIKRCTDFIKTQDNSHLYAMNVLNFDLPYSKLFKMKRYNVISIYYDGVEFVDLAITNRKINVKDLDETISRKNGLCIYKLDGYLKEFFKMLYVETVQGVDNYAYLKRNPVTGKFYKKGIKDLNRLKLLCSVNNNPQYSQFCKIDLTVENFKKMSKSQRDVYFKSLKYLPSSSQ